MKFSQSTDKYQPSKMYWLCWVQNSFTEAYVIWKCVSMMWFTWASCASFLICITFAHYFARCPMLFRGLVCFILFIYNAGDGALPFLTVCTLPGVLAWVIRMWLLNQRKKNKNMQPHWAFFPFLLEGTEFAPFDRKESTLPPASELHRDGQRGVNQGVRF